MKNTALKLALCFAVLVFVARYQIVEATSVPLLSGFNPDVIVEVRPASKAPFTKVSFAFELDSKGNSATTMGTTSVGVEAQEDLHIAVQDGVAADLKGACSEHSNCFKLNASTKSSKQNYILSSDGTNAFVKKSDSKGLGLKVKKAKKTAYRIAPTRTGTTVKVGKSYVELKRG